MTKPIARDPIYRRRRFDTEIIAFVFDLISWKRLIPIPTRFFASLSFTGLQPELQFLLSERMERIEIH